ncbi:MAG: hypothetical protein EKK57_04925 [Proteobacteria bacterium]|nr:MAG: hypothetical protein EKK57_04925 [Pseudomonadota bacterium]
MEITPENIIFINENEIFTFGSNAGGRHGKGAAKLALQFGAEYGIGEGLCGQTYALPTKDKYLNTLTLKEIRIHVNRLEECIKEYPNLTFLITAVGTGLAGYSAKDIAPLFKNISNLNNITLPASFWEVLK